MAGKVDNLHPTPQIFCEVSATVDNFFNGKPLLYTYVTKLLENEEKCRLYYTLVTSNNFLKSYWGGFFSVFTNWLRATEAKLQTATCKDRIEIFWPTVCNVVLLKLMHPEKTSDFSKFCFHWFVSDRIRLIPH